MIYRYFVFCCAICGASVAFAQGFPSVGFPSGETVPSAYPGSENPTPSKVEKIVFWYYNHANVRVPVLVANGETSYQTQAHQSAMSGELEIDCDLDKVDLPEAGKRAGV